MRDEAMGARRCKPEETELIGAIINAAAQAYRGVIPADCWHEPYMPLEALEREIVAGVSFWGCEADGALAGVMGIQAVKDVELIRHAYVAPQTQGRGLGGLLLKQLCAQAQGRILVGTWAAADWAIRFYQSHGFRLVEPERKDALLTTYWTISQRQIETSVVLEREAP